MKRFIAIFIIVFLFSIFTGCRSEKPKLKEDVLNKDFENILNSAKGTTINFYGWGGDELTNKWLDNYVGKNLKERYDINFKRIPMDIDDILNKMLGEKQAGLDKGTIDVVWINGENFYTAKEAGLLYGPFTSKLPNFNKYLDTKSEEVNKDFGFKVEGYEAPYGKAQLVFVYDESRISSLPKNHKELLEFLKKNPGKFTYPAPPDFTGSAFVRNIICDIVGYEKIANVKIDKAELEKEIKPAIDFLKEIKPYLWNNGETYPSSISQLDNMFADNEVLMSMTYNPYSVPGRVSTGQYPKNAKSFIFDKGTIGNTHFLAVPFNASNKAGALAVINFILSPEAQASKYNPENWGDLPVVDYTKLNNDEKKLFDNVKILDSAIEQKELLSHRIPEMPAQMIPIIEKIWLENIPKGE